MSTLHGFAYNIQLNYCLNSIADNPKLSSFCIQFFLESFIIELEPRRSTKVIDLHKDCVGVPVGNPHETYFIHDESPRGLKCGYALTQALQEHKDRRKKDSDAVMTMVIKTSKPSPITHQSRLGTDELFMATDPNTKQFLYYEDKEEHMKGTISLDKTLIADHPSISLYNDKQIDSAAINTETRASTWDKGTLPAIALNWLAISVKLGLSEGSEDQHHSINDFHSGSQDYAVGGRNVLLTIPPKFTKPAKASHTSHSITCDPPHLPNLGPHNVIRAKLGLPSLQWSEKIASFARYWAHQRQGDCALIHSDSDYGENLFWGSGKEWTPNKAVEAWAAEKYYNYHANTCVQNRDCFQYTQLVWKQSLKVRCAQVTCTCGDTFIVCNYEPHGNVIGQKPF
ncbi:CAP domain [Dillenia turbinata]|uniref:CAP domain n=1 Tax=Dillenia turbinata TaxID=194707 RepID=A0AAN8V6P2_9MAGN